MRRGAVLVTIDDRRIALALEAKRAEAAQARADADLAAKELEPVAVTRVIALRRHVAPVGRAACAAGAAIKLVTTAITTQWVRDQSGVRRLQVGLRLLSIVHS